MKLNNTPDVYRFCTVSNCERLSKNGGPWEEGIKSPLFDPSVTNYKLVPAPYCDGHEEGGMAA